MTRRRHVALPPRSARWLLPVGPAAVSAQSLRLYHPITPRAGLGWRAAHVFARAGGFKLLRGREVEHPAFVALSEHVPPAGYVAVASGSHAGRHTGLIVDRHGRAVAAFKTASTERGLSELAAEATALRGIAREVPAPLAAPELLLEFAGGILVEAIEWRPRVRPWRIPEPVAAAMGAFASSGEPSRIHGDFAPWNLLHAEGRWALIDWERAAATDIPYYDLIHFVTESSMLIGRPSLDETARGFTGRGWIGRSVAAYAEAARLVPSDIKAALQCYFDRLSRGLDPRVDTASAVERRRFVQRFGPPA